MSEHCFRSRSASETQALGRALGVALGEADDPGLVIALDGPLGAGKTVFVKGLAEGLGVAADLVSSPTFVIAQRYDGGALRLHHIDLYRIDDADELLGFGFDEMLDPPDVAAIEWSSRFPQALPKDRLAVR
ncbi:MAG: tRNA (adenosine(37)-N6)-threonylcarbamoyltransferase complex ATPase subunit type 1 TsaE, partial [Actinomycetota bacterium]|nr:tRNA (adenosine(37)-N6)-threonylcarbamoyltransferase complex ATPase subunit type 1 TsaE [Actinomycetota bacterium]